MAKAECRNNPIDHGRYIIGNNKPTNSFCMFLYVLHCPCMPSLSLGSRKWVQAVFLTIAGL